MTAVVSKNDRELLGAFRPCGKMSAAYWVEPGYSGEDFKSMAATRGDVTRQMTLKPGESLPEWICRSQCDACHAKPGPHLDVAALQTAQGDGSPSIRRAGDLPEPDQ